jgi:membrane protein implicated in regulation of membrane protease activity
MEPIYLACAVLGGTLFLCQFLMTLLGFAGEGLDLDAGDGLDADGSPGADHHQIADDVDTKIGGSSWFFGVLSFRTVVAALTFFGLAGMAGNAGDMPQSASLAIAVVIGLASMYAVHWMMVSISRLKAEGTVHIQNALGKTGTVYLKIPGQNSGAGKVTLSLQNRTVEYSATTANDEIPTGTPVVVTKIIGSNTLEVAPAQHA